MMFRKEAVDAQQNKITGLPASVNLLSLKIFSSCAVVFMAVIILFVSQATYTKKVSVSGVLLPKDGVVRIVAPREGILTQLAVSEGQQVIRGARIGLIDNSTMSNESDSLSSQKLIHSQWVSLQNELDKTRLLHSNEKDNLVRQIELLEKQKNKFSERVNVQRRRISILNESRRRLEKLYKQHFVTFDLLQEKELELLDAQAIVDELETHLLDTETKIASMDADLKNISFTHENKLSQLERLISEKKIELENFSMEHEIVLTAPFDGYVASVLSRPGVRVTPEKPVVIFIPKDQPLYAELYVPGQSAGFIKTGDEVNLKYQAYPYQNYGLHKGKIVNISQSALPMNDVMTFGNYTENMTELLFYKVTVALEKQTVGANHQLKAGMQLEADVIQDRLPVYRWLLQPLFIFAKEFNNA